MGEDPFFKKRVNQALKTIIKMAVLAVKTGPLLFSVNICVNGNHKD